MHEVVSKVTSRAIVLFTPAEFDQYSLNCLRWRTLTETVRVPAGGTDLNYKGRELQLSKNPIWNIHYSSIAAQSLIELETFTTLEAILVTTEADLA